MQNTTDSVPNKMCLSNEIVKYKTATKHIYTSVQILIYQRVLTQFVQDFPALSP